MKNYPHIISKIYDEPWIITKTKHRSIRMSLESKMGEQFVGTGNYAPYSGKGIEAPDYDFPEPRKFGSNYIIPVVGIIGKHLSGLELMCGGCSLDAVTNMLKYARADDTIQHIILDFDTPGGQVVGTPEAAKLIADIAEEKEISAYCETQCCSGGYWLASQANQFYCTETAQIGSVGVYALYLDETEYLKQEGIKVNAISAGKFKLSGASFQSMTKEEEAMFQEDVNTIRDKFHAAILSKRGEVDPQFLEGQVFSGDKAVENKLCDALVSDLEDILA